jgi:hypothetical protein
MKAEARARIKSSIKARRSRPRVRRDEATIFDQKTRALVAAIDRDTVTTDAEAEARALALPMAAAHRRTRMFYQSEYEALSQNEINDKLDAHQQYLRESAKGAPVAEISWQRIGACLEFDPQEAAELWLRVREAASDELESGMRCASVGMGQPLEAARFLALRDHFTDAWNPQNFIEQVMVDTLAQSYSLFLYWSQVSHERATVNVRELDARLAAKKPELEGWKLPYQKEAEAIEQAAQMADRHNRLFLRTLRQMRDLRRYAPPVIVNNGGQVNVAADGGQQVNMQLMKNK